MTYIIEELYNARTNAPTHQRTNAPTHQRTNAPTHQRTNAPTHQRTNAPTHQRTNAPTHQRTNAPTHQRTNAPTHQRTTNKYRSPKGVLRLLINNSSKTILKRSLFTLIFTPFLISLPAYSALTTIETQNIIHGTVPYLTFDNGKTKATDASSLLSIKLSDGRIFAPENNPSTPDNPIELPDGTQSLADIQMFMPVGKTSISLNELVNAPYNYGVDENGDLITATGNLTLDLRDSQDIEVNLRDKLIPCSPSDYPINYYSINLSNNEGKLTTKYGYPNTTSFNAANVIYYVIPKPIVCYIAQPNGIIGDDSFPQIDGPASQWVRHRGYLPQNIEDPATNFPTTGTHGLNFNLMLSNGVNWQNISYDKSPSSSGLDIVLNGEYSYFGGVNIFLSGPNGELIMVILIRLIIIHQKALSQPLLLSIQIKQRPIRYTVLRLVNGLFQKLIIIMKPMMLITVITITAIVIEYQL
ncbi:PT domain-containing protein [Orbaceae bacterium ESL0721]|nr:PT domain-containing protein [Orbaceae bacterium ESL0721]